MNKNFSASLALVILITISALMPVQAQARGGEYRGGLYIGCCGPHYYPDYYPSYYPGYYSGYYPGYYAPPPVVYAAPSVTYAAPVVTYASPSVTYAAPQPSVEAQPTTVDPVSPIYTDEQGQTCRQFQSGPDIKGKACLQPDGSWQVIP